MYLPLLLQPPERGTKAFVVKVPVADVVKVEVEVGGTVMVVLAVGVLVTSISLRRVLVVVGVG